MVYGAVAIGFGLLVEGVWFGSLPQVSSTVFDPETKTTGHPTSNPGRKQHAEKLVHIRCQGFGRVNPKHNIVTAASVVPRCTEHAFW